MEKIFIGIFILLYIIWIIGLIYYYIKFIQYPSGIKTSFQNYIYNNTNTFDLYNQIMLILSAVFIVISGYLISLLF